MRDFVTLFYKSVGVQQGPYKGGLWVLKHPARSVEGWPAGRNLWKVGKFSTVSTLKASGFLMSVNCPARTLATAPARPTLASIYSAMVEVTVPASSNECRNDRTCIHRVTNTKFIFGWGSTRHFWELTELPEILWGRRRRGKDGKEDGYERE